MYFNNFSGLIAMDGHGSYVWSAYAVAFLILLYNLLAPLLSRRKLVSHLRRQRKIKMQQQRVKRSSEPLSGELSPRKPVVEEGVS